MQQIAEWLERLGLVQYAQRFAENDISFSVLPDLTDQDLREIGVSLGHRRQLLRAISELTGREKDAPKAAVATAPSAAPQDAADACGFEGCPAPVTNSISPLSYRTLRPWRSVPSGHPLHSSSRQQREKPRTDQVTATAGTGSKSHPTGQSKAPTDKTTTFFDSIGQQATSVRLFEVGAASHLGQHLKVERFFDVDRQLVFGRRLRHATILNSLQPMFPRQGDCSP